MSDSQLITLTERIGDLFDNAIFVNGNDCTVAVPNEQGWKVHFDGEHHRNLAAGKVTAVISFLSSETGDDFRGGITKIHHLYEQLDKFSGMCRLVLNVEDVLNFRSRGQIGFVMGFLNSSVVENDLRTLAIFHRLGIRVMHLTYQRSNLVGDGCGDRKDGGLTRFGVQVVNEMNRLGILIDLSHSSYYTAMDAIDASSKPVVYTHTAVRALCDHIRNVSDDQIRAIASKGGLIGIISGKFLRPDIAAVGSNLEDYLDHVSYVVDLVGIDHVGIGLDVAEGQTREEWMALDERYPELFSGRTAHFEKVYSTPELRDPTQAKLNLIQGLVARGYSDDEIRKILGLNWIRIFREVWQGT